MLHERDARTLARLRAGQRWLLLAGTLLFLLGAGYMFWAVQRLHSTAAADEPGAFDRPVAGLGRLTEGVERRLGTFDGIMAVSSPLGGPTMIVMEVPCALLSPKTCSC